MLRSHLLNHDQHAAIEQSSHITEIARPLHLLNITYFNQIRIYNDLSRLSLGTDAKWLRHFFDSKYYLQGRFSKNPGIFEENKAILWLLAPTDPVSIDARINFNIDHGMTIAKRTNQYIDLFLLASTRGATHMNEFLFSNRDLLERFIAHYLETAQPIIKQCKPDTPVLHKDIKAQHDTSTHPAIEANAILEFNQKIRPKKFPVYSKQGVQTITNMEYRVVQLAIQHLQPKEIATKLHITPSTVYRHLENLRNKFSVFSTDELIALLRKNFLYS